MTVSLKMNLDFGSGTERPGLLANRARNLLKTKQTKIVYKFELPL
jgi:hypothetical protein